MHGVLQGARQSVRGHRRSRKVNGKMTKAKAAARRIDELCEARHHEMCNGGYIVQRKPSKTKKKKKKERR